MRLSSVLPSLVTVAIAVTLAPAAGWADVAIESATNGKNADSSVVGTSGPQDMSPPVERAQPENEASFQPSAELLATEPALRERVKQRWDAVIRRDFKVAYAFETPVYRKEHAIEEYASQFGSMVTWHVATVKEIRYDHENKAKTVIALEYSFPLGDGEDARTVAFIDEVWVFLDGEWWRRNIRQPLGSGR